MTDRMPRTELNTDFSDAKAEARAWDEAARMLEAAKIFFLSTVRPDGRPHVTPLIAVWLDDALWFCTGEHERKRRNIAANSHCVLMTGCNRYDEGLDIVVEGNAVRVTSEGQLRAVAEIYEAKYGPEWHFDVGNDAFQADGDEAWVYRVEPVTAFGFGKGDPFSQTRWRFA